MCDFWGPEQVRDRGDTQQFIICLNSSTVKILRSLRRNFNRQQKNGQKSFSSRFRLGYFASSGESHRRKNVPVFCCSCNHVLKCIFYLHCTMWEEKRMRQRKSCKGQQQDPRFPRDLILVERLRRPSLLIGQFRLPRQSESRNFRQSGSATAFAGAKAG